MDDRKKLAKGKKASSREYGPSFAVLSCGSLAMVRSNCNGGHTTPSILLIEPAPLEGTELADALRSGGHHVTLVGSAEAGLHALTDLDPHVIFVSLELDGIDPLWFIRTMRQTTTVPVVALSARESADVLAPALDAGADTYLIQPVDDELVVAWTAALLRREIRDQVVRPGIVTLDSWRRLALDSHARALRRGHELIELTPVEFRILTELLHVPGETLTRGVLHTRVWSDEGLQTVDRLLDSHVSRLRRKLEIDPRRPRLLKTVRGEGYRLDVAG